MKDGDPQSYVKDGKRLVLLVMALGLPGIVSAQSVSAPRSEVAVKEVILPDGVRRYAVSLKVGQTDIIAGLDTGSSGLRILPNTLMEVDAHETNRKDTYSYSAGAKLDGVVADAPVSVGDLSGTTTVQIVKRVGCSDEVPNCAAGSIPLSQYGIQGDGLPGQGFKAILGVNMAAADVASLFSRIGAKRWIIELPRPGETQPGRIVLNPTDTEVQGFVGLPILPQFADFRGGAHDAVAGCLVNDASNERFCGAVVIDTGAPGIEVIAKDISRAPWPNETPATLVLADAAGRVRVREKLVIGRRAHASRLTFKRAERTGSTLILTGLTVYFAYSVLYDPEHKTVAFKPREPGPQGPSPTTSGLP